MFDCYDWTKCPNGTVDFFQDLDPEDNEHVTPYISLGRDAYIAVYEYPKREGDMPIYVQTGPDVR